MNADYYDLIRRAQRIEACKEIGLVSKLNFPFYFFKFGTGKPVLLSAGLHGDEPAGVLAMFDFMEGEEIKKYSQDYEFNIFPCANPWGYHNSQRSNQEMLKGENAPNLNRRFRLENTEDENMLMIENTKDKNFLFAIDFHETLKEEKKIEGDVEGDDPTGFFLYEYCEDENLRIGSQIIKHAKNEKIPICDFDEIYDERNEGGVVYYPEAMDGHYKYGNTFENWFYGTHTNHILTIETQDVWPMEVRKNLHLQSLFITLDNYLQ